MDVMELWPSLIKKEIIQGWSIIIITVFIPLISLLKVRKACVKDNVFYVSLASFIIILGLIIIFQGIPRIISPEVYALETMKKLMPLN